MSPKPEISPRTIDDVFLSHQPVAIIGAAPDFRMKNQEVADLWGQKDFETLFWYCLPTAGGVIESFKGMGIPERDLVRMVLEQTRLTIEEWQPETEKMEVDAEDRLRHQVNMNARKELQKTIAAEYGLNGTDFRTVRLYFRALRKIYGNDWENPDLEIIREEMEERLKNYSGKDKPRLFDRRPAKEGGQRVDLVALVHNRFFEIAEDEAEDFGSSPEENFLKQEKESELRRELETLISKLPEDYQGVIFSRFGEEPKTLEEIGVATGRGRERIRQIEASALRKLRHPTASKKLEPFI